MCDASNSLARLMDVVKVRFLASPGGDRGLSSTCETQNGANVRTWLTAALPLRQLGPTVRAVAPASHCAALLVQRRILRPLGLRSSAVRLVLQSSVETDLAPNPPHQLCGVETRATFHFFDCLIDFDRAQTEHQIEDALDLAAARASELLHEHDDDDGVCGEPLDSAATAWALEHKAMVATQKFISGYSLDEACLLSSAEEWHFVDRQGLDDAPVAPPPLAQLYVDLRCRFGNEYLTARQAALLAALFPAVARGRGKVGAADEVVYREEMIVSLSGHVVDLENFAATARREPCSLDDALFERVCRRLGTLNVVDPVDPDGPYELDLAQPDERRMAGVLVRLALAEPGNNEVYKNYGVWRFVPGPTGRKRELKWDEGDWQFPRKWDVKSWAAIEDKGGGDSMAGIPTTGVLRLKYISANLKGKTTADLELRHDLRKYFKVGMQRPRIAGPALGENHASL